MAPITTKNTQAAKKFVVDTSAPVENGVFDKEAYIKYLVEHIKVDGIVGNLGDSVSVTEEGDNIVIVSTAKFSGKYAKYLTKRYLKKNQLKDWIRFISVKKNQYKLQFYSISESDDEDEE